MKVRLTFRCSHCGSPSFRVSYRRTTLDAILSCLGVRAHRCYICRRRFYLFQPNSLHPFLLALDAPHENLPEQGKIEAVVDGSDA